MRRSNSPTPERYSVTRKGIETGVKNHKRKRKDRAFVYLTPKHRKSRNERVVKLQINEVTQRDNHITLHGQVSGESTLRHFRVYYDKGKQKLMGSLV